MEAIVLIFGQLIFAVLAPLLAVAVDMIVALITGVASLFSRRRKMPGEGSQLARTLFLIAIAVAIVVLGALAIINTFFFSDSVRAVFSTLERRSGIETRCRLIDGNVFAGRISLSDCTVVRDDHPGSEFDLELDEAELNIAVSSLFTTATVESAVVSGLRGSIHKHQAPAEDDSPAAAEKPRRAFVIEQLDIESVDLALSGQNKDGGSFELPIRMDKATSAPLRSKFALFDILFRSNARGQIAGAGFEIVTHGDDTGRRTRWRANAVPVASFGAMAGGALSWFDEGVVDVYVEDRWRRDGQLEIEMDWRLAFRDIEVKAPDTAGTITRLASGPIVSYVNSFDGDFPFEFQMVLNEDQFEYRSSLQAAGLWSAVGESVNRLLARFGVSPDETGDETGSSLKEGAKSVLDRLRQRDPDDE